MTPHWLTRASTLRVIWIVFALVLAGTLMTEFFIQRDPHFDLEAWPGFNALYGFLACVAMILVAKGIGKLLKRPESYYGDE